MHAHKKEQNWTYTECSKLFHDTYGKDLGNTSYSKDRVGVRRSTVSFNFNPDSTIFQHGSLVGHAVCYSRLHIPVCMYSKWRETYSITQVENCIVSYYMHLFLVPDLYC